MRTLLKSFDLAASGGCPLPVSADLQRTWMAVCGELRREVSEITFHTWLEPLELAAAEGATLFVRAPARVRGWVASRYLPLLRDAATRALGGSVAVELVDEAWAVAAPAAAEAPRAAGQRLNPKYTFGQFVIGDGSRLAHAAALAVAEQPGQAYNPLFIHGPPGLGKTHLLHAIGNYIEEFGGGLRVHYATVETFTSEFVEALRRRDTGPFRERFRATDVLLVDDVQFLADKARTMEEFFHTFNALYEAGGQLVITSDRAPGELAQLEARLQERFRCGLVAELEPPGFAVRLAILRKRAGLDAVGDVDDDVLAEVARRAASSVRSLEGALIRVVAYASLTGERLTPALVERVLSRFDRAGGGTCTVERVQEATAEAFGLRPEALVASDRRPKVAFARQVAMFLARELTDESLPAIGRSFGGRNHTTVLHACRKIERDVGRQGEARDAVDNLRRRLGVSA